MGNKLVLLGGGGHCKSVLDAALSMGTFDKIVVTDPIIPKGTKVLGCEVVGTDDCLGHLRNDGYDYAFITIGSIQVNPLREKLADKAVDFGFKFPVIIDPSATLSDSAVVREGTFIGKNAIINAEVKIGRHCIVNTGAIIEHECRIEDFSHISVGTILCGEVSVGRNCMIGTGSTIIQCLRIGNKVVIGANSTVLTNVEDNMKCYGVVNNWGIA